VSTRTLSRTQAVQACEAILLRARGLIPDEDLTSRAGQLISHAMADVTGVASGNHHPHDIAEHWSHHMPRIADGLDQTNMVVRSIHACIHILEVSE
jgi:hypothetical protein